jgi:flagellar P-ring protein precursor FlgI
MEIKVVKSRILIGLLVISGLLTGPSEGIVRIKDIAKIDGIRENQLVGYGLLTGLAGTGDRQQSRFTVQSIVNMLQEMGVHLSDREIQRLRVRNAAAVIVTANVPAWTRPGAKIDATVSSLGDARDIQGGTLVLTQMKGIDGRVYGLAQGPVSIGGYNLETSGGSMIRKNHPTAGIIPNGVLIEREIPTTVVQNNQLSVVLDEPDFSTASSLVEVIDGTWPGSTTPVDAGMIQVALPAGSDLVAFVSELEALEVDNPVVRARVVINERTGTVVVGGMVRLSSVAVTHGALHVEISQDQIVPEQAAFTTVAPQAVTQDVAQVQTGMQRLVEIPATETVATLAQALNSLGVTPRDLIAIFQAIKRAGALPAELVIM